MSSTPWATCTTNAPSVCRSRGADVRENLPHSHFVGVLFDNMLKTEKLWKSSLCVCGM